MKEVKNKNFMLNRVDLVEATKKRAKELEELYHKRKKYLAQNTV